MKINNNISKSPKNLKPVYRNVSCLVIQELYESLKKEKRQFPFFCILKCQKYILLYIDSLCAGSPRHI